MSHCQHAAANRVRWWLLTITLLEVIAVLVEVKNKIRMLLQFSLRFPALVSAPADRVAVAPPLFIRSKTVRNEENI